MAMRGCREEKTSIAGRKREGAAARTQYAGCEQGFFIVDNKTEKFPTIADFDRFALDEAKRLFVPMGSSQASAMTDQQMQQLMNDPQMQELGGNLYIAKLFHYIVNNTHSGNDTKTSTLQIDSDADFQLLMLVGSRTSALATIEITEGGAGGLAWQSAPVNVDNFFGTAQLPFPAGLIPQLMPKKRVYIVKTVDTSGSANSIQIDFWGYKLFPAAQAAQLGAAPSAS
jgi:hypothetical protein